jgi:iron complex transport system substrate-binding protein
LLGNLFGEEERANDINDFYNQQLDTVFDVLDTLDESYPKPTVYNEIPYEGASNYGPSYVDGLCVTAAIDYAQGYNVATDPLSNATMSGYISPEFLLDANPDVIVLWMYGILDSSAGGSTTGYGVYPSTEEVQTVVSAYLERDGWDTLDAVKNGNVFFCNAGLGLGVENFGLLQFMAKCFYPEHFSSLEPSQNLQNFYDEFIPIPLDGTWAYSSGDILG